MGSTNLKSKNNSDENLTSPNTLNDTDTKKEFLNQSLYKHLKYKWFIHKRKYPLILEDYLGLNMRYILLRKCEGNLFVPVYWFRTQYEAKSRIVEGEVEDLIDSFFKADKIKVDDIIDLNAGQRAIHLAVLFDDAELVDYLIENDAHLMARDYNGYTPLLKAAALGRLSIVKKLINAGVPPSHKDPWGVSPLDKAILFNQTDVINYLQQLDPGINKEKAEYWKKRNLNEKFALSPWYMKQY